MVNKIVVIFVKYIIIYIIGLAFSFLAGANLYRMPVHDALRSLNDINSVEAFLTASFFSLLGILSGAMIFYGANLVYQPQFSSHKQKIVTEYAIILFCIYLISFFTSWWIRGGC